ncbi:MAG: PEP-CTERM sorting domain-containing protein [Spirochaetales bacterium]|nr:PEP-CTERM sorting domain-containing protein [Spirochaetales bacterium]
MKITKMTVCLFALTAIVATEAQASLIQNWSWTISPSTIEVTPTETIQIIGLVSNDSSSSGSLTVGFSSVEIISDWADHYDLSVEGIDLTLAPGESSTFLLGTLTPKSEAPEGLEFSFNSSLTAKNGLDPIGFSKAPSENLSVSVIPEPSSVALLLVGGMGVWMARRKRVPR